MKLETIAAIIGAVGGLSGFASLAYTILADMRRNAQERDDKVRIAVATHATGRLLTVIYQADEAIEDYALSVRSEPRDALTFTSVAGWETNAVGLNVPVRAETSNATLKVQMDRHLVSRKTDMFVNRTAGSGAKKVVVAIRRTGNGKLVGRAESYVTS